MIKKMFYRINKWFDLNLSWFFMNGRKQEVWGEYLRKKYKNGNREI